MKRDVELYRLILIAMEECPSATCHNLCDLPGVEHEVFAYHVSLLASAGLITAIDCTTNDGIDWMPATITHEGHEFLDHLRNDTVWKRTKEKALSGAGTLTVETLKMAVNSLLRHQLGG